MKASDLRIILEHVPDDLDVVIYGGRCGHVHYARRRVAQGATPALVLSGRSPMWAKCSDPHDFELSGPFRRRGELARRLDPNVPPEAVA